MKRLLSASRFVVLLAVVGAFAGGLALLVFGAGVAFQLVADAAASWPLGLKGLKALSLGLIEVVDALLLGTVFHIIALGLYELFIDDEIPVPSWLVIHDLDDLKNKLVGVVVVVIAVLSLGQLAGWDGERDLLGFGAASALLVASLTYFLTLKGGKKPPPLGDGADASGGPQGGDQA